MRLPRLLSAKVRAIRKADGARDRGSPALAAVRYQAILERWGDHPGLLVQLGNALKDSGRYDAAEAIYLKAEALRPDDADIYLQRGHLMKLIGNLESAVQLYAASARLDPGRGDAQRELDGVVLEMAVARNSAPAARFASLAALARDMPPQASIAHRRIVNRYEFRRA